MGHGYVARRFSGHVCPQSTGARFLLVKYLWVATGAVVANNGSLFRIITKGGKTLTYERTLRVDERKPGH